MNKHVVYVTLSPSRVSQRNQNVVFQHATHLGIVREFPDLSGGVGGAQAVDLRRQLAVVGAAPRPVGPAARVTHHPDELVAELLAGGAIEEEVHRVVDVHEEFADGARQHVASLAVRPDSVAVDDRQVGADVDDGHGQRGDEKSERDGEQHDGEARVALVRRPALRVHAVRAQLLTPPACQHHLR